ncbi:MAG: TldD/PmbA family protein [bacterium]
MSGKKDIRTRVLSPDEAMEEAERLCRQKRSVSGWELYLENEDHLSIEVREGEVESLVSARTNGFSVRVRSGNRIGLAYTNKLFPGSLQEAIDRACESASYLPEDEHNRFGEPGSAELPELDIVDESLDSIDRQEKIKRAETLERSALSYDPRIKRTRGAEYEEIKSEARIKNSEGVNAKGKATLCSGSLEAVAEENGQAQAADEFETVHHYDKLLADEIGAEAARKAAGLLGAGQAPTGKMPLVLDPESAAGFLSVLASAICADAVDKGRSWLSGKQGEKIASSVVNLVDDGLMTDGPGAFPFDDEGTPCGRTFVVRDGRLESFLYNLYYGSKFGVPSTGNGMRSAFYLPPSVDTSNWVMLPGRCECEDLIRKVDAGLYITELLGLHTADPVTGEFSLGASGYRIEKGTLGGPVTGLAIAGSLQEVLYKVADVGCNLKFSGDTGSPAILIEEVDVSGSGREKR